MPKRQPKAARKSHDLLLKLNERERDALDADVDRLAEQLGRDVAYQTYLRTLILAAHSGELPITPQMFRN
jgi:hypothetical protein